MPKLLILKEILKACDRSTALPGTQAMASRQFLLAQHYPKVHWQLWQSPPKILHKQFAEEQLVLPFRFASIYRSQSTEPRRFLQWVSVAEVSMIEFTRFVLSLEVLMRLNASIRSRLRNGFIQGVFKMAEFAANLLPETLRERSGFATFGFADSKSLAFGYSAAA